MENVSTEQEEVLGSQLLTTVNLEISTFNNASMLQISKDEQAQLVAPIPLDEIEIRPDGFIYWPQSYYRRKLNEVFGIGQWSIIPKDIKKEVASNSKVRIFFVGCMYIRGSFASLATGEAIYNTTNPNQSYASATEAAKSDCIVRCCKDIGLASEIWQPSFNRRFQREHAVRVFLKPDPNDSSKQEKTAWRRKDVDPFWNETGLVPTKVNVPEKPKFNGEVSALWLDELSKVKTKNELLMLYNKNQATIDQWPELKAAFKTRETQLPKVQKQNA